MFSAFITGFLEVLVENLPQLERVIGRAAFLLEADRILHALGNASLAVQHHKAQLVALMKANDAAVDAAEKKHPNPSDGDGKHG